MSRYRNTARDPEAQRYWVELRRSNAAVPIPSGRVYRRRPKHRGAFAAQD